MASELPEILTTARFYLELSLNGSDAPIDGYFMECQGFKVTQDSMEISEVTPAQWGNAKSGLVVRTKIHGNRKISNVTLKRGLTISTNMWTWFDNVHQSKAQQRKDGSLVIYNQGADEVVRFNFFRAWPTSYKIGDLKASSNEFEIEELELVIEDLVRVK